MTIDLFDKITDTRSSWALWPDSDDCKKLRDYFKKNIIKLKPNIIYLGLNPSDTINDCENFHKSANDKILKKQIIKFVNLQGGFMTDLYSIENKNSKEVKGDTNEIRGFINKLQFINSPEIKIICFGDKVYLHLRDYLEPDIEIRFLSTNLLNFSIYKHNIKIDIYRVWHYSNWRKNKFLKDQLKQLDEFIK
jgi:hypothetical protein